MGNTQERPTSKLFTSQPQQLQKPNELDNARGSIDNSPKAGQESNTVYSTSTNNDEELKTDKIL